MFFFNPLYLIFVSPALLLALWAQMRVKSTYHEGQRVDARLTGAAAARHILDQAGCYDVGIEVSQGMLTDHYDPTHRVLRLSPEVYHNRSAASVGIAAHEAGHALQHAEKYAPLAIRNAAVPVAQFGSSAAIILFMIGLFMVMAENALGHGLAIAGLIGFGGVAVFQLVNLPVEFDASNRAKRILDQYGIVDEHGAAAVRRVLNAAAWTYVAATLQAILMLLYFIFRFSQVAGGSRD
ncbi:MAG: zinc metallopeptidase [Planctomycetes bacterium]|nr:zinc metallopeptidase [Planctomycetota bacterium]